MLLLNIQRKFQTPAAIFDAGILIKSHIAPDIQFNWAPRILDESSDRAHSKRARANNQTNTNESHTNTSREFDFFFLASIQLLTAYTVIRLYVCL